MPRAGLEATLPFPSQPTAARAGGSAASEAGSSLLQCRLLLEPIWDQGMLDPRVPSLGAV